MGNKIPLCASATLFLGLVALTAQAQDAPRKDAGPKCDRVVSADPAKVDEARAAQPSGKKGKHARRAKGGSDKGRMALSDDPTPTLQPETADCTRAAAERYRKIADDGGWPNLPRKIERKSKPDDISLLRQRLAAEGDLDSADGDRWDEDLTKAIKSFQERAGIAPSGAVDEVTLKALNVPADERAKQLAGSADRLKGVDLNGKDRMVVVNIPAADVEAIEGGRVVERHAGIAGDPDHQSPEITARITSVTINPTWTIPRSIVENEVIPKLQKRPTYLKTAHIDVLNRKGREIDPRRIDWSQEDGAGLTFRQEPGSKNSLGTLRIDMPNKEAVYLHDTPAKNGFAENYRFLSHGCVRVDGIYDLAAWLLRDVKGREGPVTRERIESLVKDEDTKRVTLAKPIPVAWVYLDAWADAGGKVHFRPDVYNLDGSPEAQAPARRAASR